MMKYTYLVGIFDLNKHDQFLYMASWILYKFDTCLFLCKMYAYSHYTILINTLL